MFGRKLRPSKQKKPYKGYPVQMIGDSDYATLIVMSPSGPKELYFGEDGAYSAYIVDENAEIGSHYKKVHSIKNWVKIYDDNGLTFHANAHEINIYRAGEFGCIIQLIGAF